MDEDFAVMGYLLTMHLTNKETVYYSFRVDGLEAAYKYAEELITKNKIIQAFTNHWDRSIENMTNVRTNHIVRYEVLNFAKSGAIWN